MVRSWIGTHERVQLRLKELPMPDLDQIKQGEQECGIGAGGSPRAGLANPAGRPRGCRDHVNRAARLLLAGEGEALTPKSGHDD
jgi:hypothetical protein